MVPEHISLELRPLEFSRQHLHFLNTHVSITMSYNDN